VRQNEVVLALDFIRHFSDTIRFNGHHTTKPVRTRGWVSDAVAHGNGEPKSAPNLDSKLRDAVSTADLTVTWSAKYGLAMAGKTESARRVHSQALGKLAGVGSPHPQSSNSQWTA